MSTLSGKFDMTFFFTLGSKGQCSIIDWCMNMDLIAKEYECPICKLPMKLSEHKEVCDDYAWICRGFEENEHQVERDIRQGSFFEESELSLIHILVITYLWVKQAPTEFIADELNLPESSVLEWQNFCREVCLDMCVTKNGMLGGTESVVEIEVSRLEERKYKKGKRVVGNFVFGGIDKKEDKSILVVVENGNKEELLDVIKKYILPGTTIVSDCWQYYDCLEDDDFIELAEKHDMTFKDSKVGSTLNIILGLQSSRKKLIDNAGRPKDTFDSYLAEFVWRQTHSQSPYYLFRDFLKEIILVYPPDTKDDETW